MTGCNLLKRASWPKYSCNPMTAGSGPPPGPLKATGPSHMKGRAGLLTESPTSCSWNPYQRDGKSTICVETRPVSTQPIWKRSPRLSTTVDNGSRATVLRTRGPAYPAVTHGGQDLITKTPEVTGNAGPAEKSTGKRSEKGNG